MNARAVEAYTKTGILSSPGSKNLVFRRNLKKLPQKRKFLTVQGDFDKIIDIERTELCFLSV
ncbi:unnamed protein product [marine sediment metagenome]|uniref:Uncharacterized protein n=1 Tax=marine sediment metagenome TaxID=412755 RepID=X0YYH9_9ZZZZ